MAFPPRRVWDARIAITGGCGAIKNPANAVKHSPRCLRAFDPYWIERASDQPGIDRSDRQLAKDGVNVFVKSGAPIICAASGPARLLRSDKGFSGVGEGLRLRGVDTARQLIG